MLEVGTKAPDFILPDQHGNPVRLSDFLGQKVVLYFYPRDNTPGCTRQACAFGVAYGQLQAKGVVVIGISKDTVTSHEKFAAKHALPFLILSDPEHRVIEAYDVWKEKKLYGKVSMGTRYQCIGNPGLPGKEERRRHSIKCLLPVRGKDSFIMILWSKT